jgi:uncharacterized protein (DUF111 family)
VRVKVAKAPGRARPLKARPEYQDCRRIAERTGLPLREVTRGVERDVARALRRPKA